jgi:hypothetical protein
VPTSKLSREFHKTTNKTESSYDGNQSKGENNLKSASETKFFQSSLDTKQPTKSSYSSIKKCKVNLTKIPIPTSNETVFCPNCNEKVANLPLHFEHSLICSQLQFHQTNIECNSEPKKTSNKKKITKDIKKGVTKCLSCSKEFVNLNFHLKKIIFLSKFLSY